MKANDPCVPAASHSHSLKSTQKVKVLRTPTCPIQGQFQGGYVIIIDGVPFVELPANSEKTTGIKESGTIILYLHP